MNSFKVGDKVKGRTATGTQAEGEVVRAGASGLLLDCGKVISKVSAELLYQTGERVQLSIWDALVNPEPLPEPGLEVEEMPTPPSEPIAPEPLPEPAAEQQGTEFPSSEPEPAQPPKKKRQSKGIEFPKLAPGEAALNYQQARIRVYQQLIDELTVNRHHIARLQLLQAEAEEKIRSLEHGKQGDAI